MRVAGVDAVLAAGVHRHRRASDDVLEGRRATSARSFVVSRAATRAVGVLTPDRRTDVAPAGANKLRAAPDSTSTLATASTTVAVAAGSTVGIEGTAVAAGPHRAIVGATSTSATTVGVTITITTATATRRVTRRAHKAGATAATTHPITKACAVASTATVWAAARTASIGGRASATASGGHRERLARYSQVVRLREATRTGLAVILSGASSAPESHPIALVTAFV